MDLDSKKRQTLKVLLVEAFMAISVVIMVVVLVLIVSGYWINGDFKLEQAGMLRINFVPSGVDVIIDGEKNYNMNDYSKVISSDEHTIVLEKEGYDSWSKTITITKGLIYQIRYPRLFLKERKKEHVMDFDGLTFATVSPDQKGMLYVDKTNKLSFINLLDEKSIVKQLDNKPFEELAPSITKIENALWSQNSKRVVLKVSSTSGLHWLYVDLDNGKNSFDITNEFKSDFEDVLITDGSANELLVYSNKTLRKIDVPRRTLSEVVLENVDDFYPFERGNIVFVSHQDNQYYIGLLRGTESSKIMDLEDQARIVATHFYNDKYLIVFTNNSLSVYQGDELKSVFNDKVSINTEALKVIGGDGFVVARDENEILALDMEAMRLSIWDAQADGLGWMDDYLIYSVWNGELYVCDFDGQNKRLLSSSVSADYPVTITDNKWLYYFSDGALVREWLIQK